ncbi:MAG: hypothetical protein P1U40_09865 [Coxiellaceae bacterium]|nr:hypothetical protein [Coxiellaceae bacterium]
MSRDILTERLQALLGNSTGSNAHSRGRQGFTLDGLKERLAALRGEEAAGSGQHSPSTTASVSISPASLGSGRSFFSRPGSTPPSTPEPFRGPVDLDAVLQRLMNAANLLPDIFFAEEGLSER